jgi:hypothetical protein
MSDNLLQDFTDQFVGENHPTIRPLALEWDREGRTAKALCPLHQEKTPSFLVDFRKKKWICFGCGKKGEVNGKPVP